MSEVFKFEGNIVNLAELFDSISYFEVRNRVTNHLLGYLSLPPHIVTDSYIRIPLIKSPHSGVKFDFYDNFPEGFKYREFQVRTAYSNKGRELFRYIEADFNDWSDIVKDKKDSFATEYLTIGGVDYVRLSEN